MRYLKMLAFALLPVVLLAVGGCGGGSGGSTSDPFAGTSTTGGTATPPVFNNVSTPTGKINLSLTTDTSSIDVNNGQVLAIAKVTAGQTAVAGMPVTFRVLAPTNLATIETATVTTDSTGTAVTRITTGDAPSTTNVLISASIPVGSQTVSTNASFQIVRGGGVIMFASNAGMTPGGQSNVFPTVDFSVPAGSGLWRYFQLVPFKVTDSNGNARVGVPVTLSVYSINTMNPDDVLIDFLVNPASEPNQQTITSDSAGQGIFNTRVNIMAPSIVGGQTTVSVVYKAVTNDTPQVTAYLGVVYHLTGIKPPE